MARVCRRVAVRCFVWAAFLALCGARLATREAARRRGNAHGRGSGSLGGNAIRKIQGSSFQFTACFRFQPAGGTSARLSPSTRGRTLHLPSPPPVTSFPASEQSPLSVREKAAPSVVRSLSVSSACFPPSTAVSFTLSLSPSSRPVLSSEEQLPSAPRPLPPPPFSRFLLNKLAIFACARITDCAAAQRAALMLALPALPLPAAARPRASRAPRCVPPSAVQADRFLPASAGEAEVHLFGVDHLRRVQATGAPRQRLTPLATAFARPSATSSWPRSPRPWSSRRP